MNDTRYIIGIDLGTTHSLLAYTDTRLSDEADPVIRVLPVPQVVSPGEVRAQALLPSFLMLPGPHDVPAGSLALPWDAQMDFVVGEFARKRGAELPNRLVSSAKSWLCHSGVDLSTRDIVPVPEM